MIVVLCIRETEANIGTEDSKFMGPRDHTVVVVLVTSSRSGGLQVTKKAFLADLEPKKNTFLCQRMELTGFAENESIPISNYNYESCNQ